MYTPRVSFLGHWWPSDVSEPLYRPDEVFREGPVAAHKGYWGVPCPSSIPNQGCNRNNSVVWATPLLREPALPSLWLHSELTSKIPPQKAFQLPCEKGQSHQQKKTAARVKASSRAHGCWVKMMSLCHVWGWQPIQTASHIHLRNLQSVWAHWYAHRHMVPALNPCPPPTWLRCWSSGSFVESKWCHYVMVEADSHLKLLSTSILYIHKVFEHIDIRGDNIKNTKNILLLSLFFFWEPKIYVSIRLIQIFKKKIPRSDSLGAST